MFERNNSEEFIYNLEDRCSNLSKDIITKLCKRAVRRMNNWKGDDKLNGKKIPANLEDCLLCEDYPKIFTFFDILSIQIQSYSYEEINPYLEDFIRDVLEDEYSRLNDLEQLALDYSECSEYFECNHDSLMNKIFDIFHDMLNEHWGNSKKIENYEWRH